MSLEAGYCPPDFLRNELGGSSPPLNGLKLALPLCPLWLIVLHQVLLEILRKSLHRRLNWPRRGITQRTKRFAFDVVTQIEQELSIFRTAAATFNAFEYLHQPVGPFTTRRAPTARFMFVKLSQVLG